MVERGVEVHERESLVGYEDLDAQVVGMLNRGEADRWVFQREPAAGRTPGCVDLERGRRTRRHRARHLIECCTQGPDVGGDDVLHEQTTGATVDEPVSDLL